MDNTSSTVTTVRPAFEATPPPANSTSYAWAEKRLSKVAAVAAANWNDPEAYRTLIRGSKDSLDLEQQRNKALQERVVAAFVGHRILGVAGASAAPVEESRDGDLEIESLDGDDNAALVKDLKEARRGVEASPNPPKSLTKISIKVTPPAPTMSVPQPHRFGFVQTLPTWCGAPKLLEVEHEAARQLVDAAEASRTTSKDFLQGSRSTSKDRPYLWAEARLSKAAALAAANWDNLEVYHAEMNSSTQRELTEEEVLAEEKRKIEVLAALGGHKIEKALLASKLERLKNEKKDTHETTNTRLPKPATSVPRPPKESKPEVSKLVLEDAAEKDEEKMSLQSGSMAGLCKCLSGAFR